MWALCRCGPHSASGLRGALDLVPPVWPREGFGLHCARVWPSRSGPQRALASVAWNGLWISQSGPHVALVFVPEFGPATFGR